LTQLGHRTDSAGAAPDKFRLAQSNIRGGTAPSRDSKEGIIGLVEDFEAKLF
jgi:hypothetical protein